MLIILVTVVLAARYSPRYVYRLVKYNVADVFDYKHFENRVMEAADSTFSFTPGIDENYVESLFRDKVVSYGFSSLNEWAEKSFTTALIVIRRDTILYEKYFNEFSRDSWFHSQSMAKSFISTLIGFAIEDGYIHSVDDPMTLYVPELSDRDANFGRITIKNLLMMQSGLKYNESYLPGIGIHAPWHDEAVGYYHGNVRKLLLKRVKIAGAPGEKFQYNNYNTAYLGLIIERSTGKPVSEYLEEKLWSRIMEYDALFSVDSKKNGFEYMPSRLIARAIDYARFGRLFLNNGEWDGSQLLPQDWIREVTTEDRSISRDLYPPWMGSGSNRTYYTYQWWGHVSNDSSYRFFASGNLGQDIYVIPAEETIIVHCGNSLEYYNADVPRSVSEKIN
jgi:CubicO group peptidase (beta-lactamase class C family)